MVALVSLVAGGLIVAGAGSLVLTRNSARNQARQQLVTEVQSLTSHPASHPVGARAQSDPTCP